MSVIFIHLVNTLCRCSDITTPPFYWAYPFPCILFFHVCWLLQGYVAFLWGLLTYAASPAAVLWEPCSVGWRGKRKRTLTYHNSWQFVCYNLLFLWPGVHGTGSRWCSWSDPQCSRPRGRSQKQSSQSSWLSHSLSCWWKPGRGPHTGGWGIVVGQVGLPFTSFILLTLKAVSILSKRLTNI